MRPFEFQNSCCWDQILAAFSTLLFSFQGFLLLFTVYYLLKFTCSFSLHFIFGSLLSAPLYLWCFMEFKAFSIHFTKTAFVFFRFLCVCLCSKAIQRNKTKAIANPFGNNSHGLCSRCTRAQLETLKTIWTLNNVNNVHYSQFKLEKVVFEYGIYTIHI